MSWDSSLPTNDTKIRNLGVEIRPNWEALERGDDVTAVMVNTSSTMLQQYSAQFIERNARANTNDPVTEADTFYMYCKQDGGGIAEGHVKNPAGNIVQLTQGTFLGSDATDIAFLSFSPDSGTTSYTGSNFVTAWITVDSSGNSVSAGRSGLTSSRSVTGRYTITFDTAVINTTYGVTLGLDHAPGNATSISYLNKAVGSFEVYIVNSSGTFIDKAFSVMVTGGR